MFSIGYHVFHVNAIETLEYASNWNYWVVAGYFIPILFFFLTYIPLYNFIIKNVPRQNFLFFNFMKKISFFFWHIDMKFHKPTSL